MILELHPKPTDIIMTPHPLSASGLYRAAPSGPLELQLGKEEQGCETYGSLETQKAILSPHTHFASK